MNKDPTYATRLAVWHMLATAVLKDAEAAFIYVPNEFKTTWLNGNVIEVKKTSLKNENEYTYVTVLYLFGEINVHKTTLLF